MFLCFAVSTCLVRHTRRFSQVPEDMDKLWEELTSFNDELEQRERENSMFPARNRITADYVVMLTKKHPNEMVRQFYQETNPAAQTAVQNAITALIGTPALDSTWMTTGRQVAQLCFKLQMTGYMLRNAEYVLALRQVLNITELNYAEVSAAFESVDRDRDGFLQRNEVAVLLDGKKEVESFMRYFDDNKDGKVSFHEFAQGIAAGEVLEDDVADDEFNSDITAGMVELIFPNRTSTFVDAKQYVAELQQEAVELRAALAASKITDIIPQSEEEQVTSLVKYVDDLDEPRKRALSKSLTPHAREAIEVLIDFMLTGATDGAKRDYAPTNKVEMERQVLEHLCRWQIIVGYRLRELEATGVAYDKRGRPGFLWPPRRRLDDE